MLSSMEERPIRFHLLNKDELLYEVAIRDGEPSNTVEKLRTQIKKLVLEIPTDEVDVFEGDVTSELLTVQSKLAELDTICEKKPLLLKRLYRMQALGNHLFHRLSRVGPVAEGDVTLKKQLDDHLWGILQRIDKLLHTFSSSFESPVEVVPSASGPQTASVEDGFVDAQGESFVKSVYTCDRQSKVHALNWKFNGKDNVIAFIQRLEELCFSRDISDKKLFHSAAELFVDEALFWYRAVKNEVTDWPQLKALLLEEYLPYDYDHRLLQEIRARTQGSDESITHFLSIMENYFSRLRRPLDAREKLDIVRFNIRPFYATQLALVDITSWSDLKTRGRLLEAAKLRSEFFNEPPRSLTNAVAQDLAYKGKVSRPRCDAVVTDSDKFCVRCRVKGHTLLDCKAPRVAVCYRCGEKGVTAVNCPNCAPKLDSIPESKNE